MPSFLTPPNSLSSDTERELLERKSMDGSRPPFFCKEEFNAARKAALDLLARREHLRSELLQKIKQRHQKNCGSQKSDAASDASRVFTDALLDRVLDQLQAEGLQSDERYLYMFLRSRVQQGYGLHRIRQELKSKKVSEHLLAHVIDTLPEDEAIDWFQQARLARSKKFGAPIPLETKEIARQMRFLQYRGFSAEQIRDALSQE